MTTNQACCNFVVDPAGADYRFLYYYLKGNYSNLVNLKLGGSQQNLNAATLKRFPVPAIPMQAQQKIAAILSAYDDLIANNQRRIALLETMAEEIYREWFVRMRFPGRGTCDRSHSMPTGCVPMDRLSTSSMYFDAEGKRSGAAGSKFRNGDTLIPRITPSLENGKRGYVTCLEDGEVGVGSTEFIVLRGRLVSKEHAYFLSITDELRKHAELSMTGASGRQRVQEDCFGFFLVAVPPEGIAEKLTHTVGPMFQLIESLSRQNRKLAGVRDALLPRLISGKLKVDHLDIQRPPSMLDKATA